MKEYLQDRSHKRLNILTNEWVLVSPHRNRRPWQGQQSKLEITKEQSYDKNCYLCPGNVRAGGHINPEYSSTFLFDNDFAALTNSTAFQLDNGLLHAHGELGVCKVVCFSPDHSKSLANMEVSAIQNVVELWQTEFIALSQLEHIRYIQIFENKGEIMGCSNPHPHGQIWAQSSIPNEVLKKDMQQKIYFDKTQSSLLGAYLAQEIHSGERIIWQNDDFVTLIPFWAVWPFESMIVPKKHQVNMATLNASEKYNFAEAIKVITATYDQIFDCSFPYSSGIHQAPTDQNDQNHWHWHMSFYPPLLRSATVKKFMVGYEMFAMPQRDITAEQAAEVIRNKLA
ncbi:MAG: UDP-glucose--hexose-1-phosphate uridylyltransferase [Bacteroidetes bacterium]|nr:UDP-glucose--hexose-1-phosphate uridylyltransferase [Bacteroidota bacterium]